MAESDVVVVSSKGQVVIPQSLREKLRIEPKSKLLVFGRGDALIMKKLEVKDAVRSMQALYERIDARIVKYGELTSEEIQREIEQYRAEKRRRKRA